MAVGAGSGEKPDRSKRACLALSIGSHAGTRSGDGSLSRTFLSSDRVRAFAALLVLGLTGCSTYHPEPLQPETQAALRQPEPTVLANAAAHLDHPVLPPLQIDFAKPLPPDALAILAVIANPELQAARKREGVASAELLAARLLPDPMLNFSHDRRLSGPDPFDALAGQVAYDLAALRDRRAVMAVAHPSREQLRLDIAWQEWQVAAQAKLLAARITGLSRTVEIASAAKADQEDILARVARAADHGDISGAILETRRLAAALATERLRHAERDLSAARLDLNRLLALAPATRLAIAPSVVSNVLWNPDDLFQHAKFDRLDLRALEAGYASQEANVHIAVLDQFPRLNLTINRAQDTAFNQTTGPAINFAVPLRNRNRGGLAVTQATRDQLRSEYAAREFATRADIAMLVDGLALARRQRDEAERQIPPLQELVAASDLAVRRGDLTAPSASAMRQNLFDKQIAVIGLDQWIAEQTAALELSVGRPLASLVK